MVKKTNNTSYNHSSESGATSGQRLINELRAARESCGWSRKDLAQQVGSSPQAIQRLERGNGSVNLLLTVMEALSFSLAGVGQGATLPEQLANKRKQGELSVETVSARTGVSCATIVDLEQANGEIDSLLQVLSALAPKAKRRAPERAYWGPGKKKDRDARFTPADFMNSIYDAFGPVDLDPCGNVLSQVEAKRIFLLSQGDDGMRDAWSGKLAFVNPPYSELVKWLERMHDQWSNGNITTAVALVPVRTDSKFFHHTLSQTADFFLLKGRLKFGDSAGGAQSTPYSLMVVTLGATERQKARLAELVPGVWVRVKRSTPALMTPGEVFAGCCTILVYPEPLPSC